ncbi:AaceriAAR163Cp [[Ashbya] aceris (nom. inval.)]|nr:AaceriAAR163Cp [[Ashbya] aceris (nom. inval.)]
MKPTLILSLAALAACAPIQPSDLAEAAKVPADAVVGFLELYNVGDMALVPVDNGVHSGILFVNSTLAHLNEPTQPRTRAVSQKWHWLRFGDGQSM